MAHQLRKNREEVLEMARTQVARAKGYLSDVEFSAMDASRSDPGVRLSDARASDRGRRHYREHPRHGRLLRAGGVRGLHSLRVRQGAQHRQGRRLRTLPRRPRHGGRQLAGRRARRSAPGRMLRQRHRRAGGQRLAGGDRHGAEDAPRLLRRHDGHQHEGALPHEPPRLRPDGDGGPAEQGDRRRQRFPPSVRPSPGRHPEDARDLRDHRRARDGSSFRRRRDRPRQALRPARLPRAPARPRLRSSPATSSHAPSPTSRSSPTRKRKSTTATSRR